MPNCTATAGDLAFSPQQKSQIAEATTVAHSTQIVDITAEYVRIDLQHIPATRMIEFGRFLPEPGDEAEWEKVMSPEKWGSLPKQQQ
ncbi:hypothetical protein [Marinobacter nauticus]|uniref:hypothetical protein n=1 Tax=Marinobacter nauticus TaxID=2743 RepID=UPI0035168180